MKKNSKNHIWKESQASYSDMEIYVCTKCGIERPRGERWRDFLDMDKDYWSCSESYIWEEGPIPNCSGFKMMQALE